MHSFRLVGANISNDLIWNCHVLDLAMAAVKQLRFLCWAPNYFLAANLIYLKKLAHFWPTFRKHSKKILLCSNDVIQYVERKYEHLHLLKLVTFFTLPHRRHWLPRILRISSLILIKVVLYCRFSFGTVFYCGDITFNY